MIFFLNVLVHLWSDWSFIFTHICFKHWSRWSSIGSRNLSVTGYSFKALIFHIPKQTFGPIQTNIGRQNSIIYFPHCCIISYPYSNINFWKISSVCVVLMGTFLLSQDHSWTMLPIIIWRDFCTESDPVNKILSVMK